MFRTDWGGLFRAGHSDAICTAATHRRTGDDAPVILPLTRGVRIIIAVLLVSTVVTCVSLASESDTPTAAPGIANPMDPYAYMRELAARLDSTDGKELLLRGARNEPAPRTAAQPAPKKSAPVKATMSPSQPTGTAAPSRPLTLSMPNRPAAAAKPNVMAVRNPNPSAAPLPPLSTANWLSTYNRAAQEGYEDIQMEQLTVEDTNSPINEDLEKYRAYAVREGSRNSGESLVKALMRAGVAVGDGANLFLLGYASDRTKAVRANDGKSLFDEPGKVPMQAGATVATAAEGLYSLADLITLNLLPDPNDDPYKDNQPLVRPILFTGRTIGGVWKTTEEVGNAVTWGLFDNVTGCVGLLLEDIIEVLKHTGEAVTNLARLPGQLSGTEDENGQKTMDWILLVPLELVANSVEMKGISNMQDYETAFAEKGVIGSILEFGGSAFIVYRAVDRAVDKWKDDHDSSSNSGGSGGQSGGGSSGGTVPVVPELPEDAWVIFSSDGFWTTSS